MEHARLKTPLEMNFKQGEKLKVSPKGEVLGFDGREYIIDAQKVLSSLRKNDVHIPLDENHFFGEAFGWFDKNSFEEREDGIYAELELTPKGEEKVGQKAYRYLSPVFVMGNNREVESIDSVGLVNRPNLLTKELNQKEENGMDELKTLRDEVAQLKESVEKLAKVQTPPTQETPANEEANAKIVAMVETLQTQVTEMNEKLKVFGKKEDLEENQNLGAKLTDEDKRICAMLGVDEQTYLTQKGAK